jgi:hypothetical protein
VDQDTRCHQPASLTICHTRVVTPLPRGCHSIGYTDHAGWSAMGVWRAKNNVVKTEKWHPTLNTRRARWAAKGRNKATMWASCWYRRIARPRRRVVGRLAWGRAAASLPLPGVRLVTWTILFFWLSSTGRVLVVTPGCPLGYTDLTGCHEVKPCTVPRRIILTW